MGALLGGGGPCKAPVDDEGPRLRRVAGKITGCRVPRWLGFVADHKYHKPRLYAWIVQGTAEIGIAGVEAGPRGKKGRGELRGAGSWRRTFAFRG